jgi:SAM-dependent methyltransferase
MNNSEYASYLRGRSLLGFVYRGFYLYPKLDRFLKGRILDIGCGVGDFLAYKKQAIGVDINPFNVDYCVQRGLNALLMDVDKLPQSDESFDVVVLDNVLEHINDPFPILAEIRRVLDSEGCLVVGVPGLKGYASDADHKVFYDEALLEDVAIKSGFRIKEYAYAPLFKSKYLSEKMSQYCIYSVWVPQMSRGIKE